MSTPISQDCPIVAYFLAHPGQWVRADQFPGLDRRVASRRLAQLADKGHAERREYAPRRTEYRLVRAPRRPAPGRKLHPPAPGYAPLVGVLIANPGEWVTREDLRATLGAGAVNLESMSTLRYHTAQGRVESRQNVRGMREYRLKGPRPMTTTETAENASRVSAERRRVRVAAPQPPKAQRPAPESRPTAPTPAQLAHRQRVAEQKRERQVRDAAIKEELRMQREQNREEVQRLKDEKRREQERLNLEIQRQDREALRAWMAGRPGQSFVEGEAQAGLGLPMPRTRNAIRGLEALGLLLADRSDHAVRARYRLLDPELPQVPAVMTRGAQRVLDALHGRPAETELGLMHSTGYAREEVRAGLARLHALGRLGWGAVGHLILYRLVEVRAEAEGVAA